MSQPSYRSASYSNRRAAASSSKSTERRTEKTSTLTRETVTVRTKSPVKAKDTQAGNKRTREGEKVAVRTDEKKDEVRSECDHDLDVRLCMLMVCSCLEPPCLHNTTYKCSLGRTHICTPSGCVGSPGLAATAFGATVVR